MRDIAITNSDTSESRAAGLFAASSIELSAQRSIERSLESPAELPAQLSKEFSAELPADLYAESPAELPADLYAESPAESTAAKSPATPRGTPHELLADSDQAWGAELVLARSSWRERAASTQQRRGEQTPQLEWQPQKPLLQRISRAVSMPVLAGVAVFVLAVAITIVLTLVQTGHGSAHVAADATGDGAADGSAGAKNNESAPSGPDESTTGSSDTRDPEADQASDPTSGDATPVLVHVVGEVKSPGVVELAAGSRVTEAITAAGGVTELGALSAVNLARIVVDGEQLVIPNLEQVAAGIVAPHAEDGGGALSSASGSVGGNATGNAVGALINLNTADIAQLETLPRIGPALAQRIIDWRDTNGGFSSIEQLLEVTGVGAKTFEGMRDQVTV